MPKALVIIIYILVLSLPALGQVRKSNIRTAHIDSTTFVVFGYSKDHFYRVFKDAEPADLSFSDIVRIEEILDRCIDSTNRIMLRHFREEQMRYPNEQIDKNEYVLHLPRYKRYYVPVTNSNGEKEVWISFFCDADGRDWRNEFRIVRDGGNCYFQLKINLKTRQCYDLFINGVAWCEDKNFNNYLAAN